MPEQTLWAEAEAEWAGLAPHLRLLPQDALWVVHTHRPTAFAPRSARKGLHSEKAFETAGLSGASQT